MICINSQRDSSVLSRIVQTAVSYYIQYDFLTYGILAFMDAKRPTKVHANDDMGRGKMMVNKVKRRDLKCLRNRLDEEDEFYIVFFSDTI